MDFGVPVPHFVLVGVIPSGQLQGVIALRASVEFGAWGVVFEVWGRGFEVCGVGFRAWRVRSTV